MTVCIQKISLMGLLDDIWSMPLTLIDLFAKSNEIFSYATDNGASNECPLCGSPPSKHESYECAPW